MASLTEVENDILHHLQKKVSTSQEVSLAQLASECHVAQSTIVKVAKKMGYSGFVELYYHIRTQKEKHRESLFFAQDLIDGDLKENMRDMADLLWRHRKHKNFIFSTNDNDILSTYFSRKLGMFDFLAPATYDYVMAQSEILPHGLAFFLESREQSRPYLQEMLEIAKKENFYIIILCDTIDAWLEKQADKYVIITKTDRGGADFYSAKVLMWIEILLSAYAARCMQEREA